MCRAHWASPLYYRLPGRGAFGESAGDLRAFGASTTSPFGRERRRGVKAIMKDGPEKANVID